MTHEEPENRRFGRIRDLGDGVAEATRSITGQSATEKIAEFTDAYTETVTGLDAETQALNRNVSEIQDQIHQLATDHHLEVVALKNSVRRLSILVVAAIVTGGVAVLLAVLI